jgi:hypothetical protein
MILQRDTKINIWGWATKGEKKSDFIIKISKLQQVQMANGLLNYQE